MGPQSNFVLQWYISRQSSPSIVPGDVNLAELFDAGATFREGQMFDFFFVIFVNLSEWACSEFHGISMQLFFIQLSDLSGEEETEEDKKNKPEPKQLQDED